MEIYSNTVALPYASIDKAEEHYPETDGKPMAETEKHRDEIMRALQTLPPHFAKVPDVCVSGNMMMYYVEGNAQYAVSPDVFVAFGVERKERRTYKIWEEGKPPDFVLEFSSKRTFRRDLDSKKTRYAALGVREYFLYDADKRYLPSPLMGFRLVGRDYIQIPARADGSVHSATLELALHIRPEGLRFYEPVAQRWLQTPAEAAEARAEAAEERAEAAEAEAARLREELERLKARR